MTNSDESINSYINPVLSFNATTSIFLEENYFLPIISAFFKKRNIIEYNKIKSFNLFSIKEFKQISIKDIYNLFFSDIKKENNEIHFSVKFGITFDEENISQICPETNLKFSEIKLYKRTVFYYFYFDLKEVLQFLKENIYYIRNYN